MNDPSLSIAHTLKQFRKDRGWSLDACAAATGVSKAMLGQIERGESSPTMATMWKLATGLNIPFSAFWDDAARLAPGSAAPVYSADPEARMKATLIQPFDARTGVEILEVELAVGCERLAQGHQAGMFEYVVVIEGTMAVLRNSEWMVLAEGASSMFAADAPHGYRNEGERPARFLNVITHPRASER